jgi:hypothetical protein
MIYEQIQELKDTDFDIYFYADCQNWQKSAALGSKLSHDVLAEVSDQKITGYEQEGQVITTTYENGTVITVNLETGEILNGKRSYMLSDYLEEGAEIS